MVTPGTVVDPTMLDARTNNYLVAVVADGKRAGVAYADITTGEFATTEIAAGSAEEALLAAGRELLRLGPAEIVLPAGMSDAAASGGERLAAGRGWTLEVGRLALAAGTGGRCPDPPLPDGVARWIRLRR